MFILKSKTMKKTVSNLETVWQHLDDACGSLDNALTNISMMKDMPEHVKNSAERLQVEFENIVSLKNKIEEMVESKKAASQ